VAAAASVSRVSQVPPPMGTLVRFGTNGLDLEISFWITDPQKGRSGAISDVNRAIWKVLQEQNIELPLPQRDIRILNLQELAINPNAVEKGSVNPA
jgi:small-conductance mechanosensitive channel